MSFCRRFEWSKERLRRDDQYVSELCSLQLPLQPDILDALQSFGVIITGDGTFVSS